MARYGNQWANQWDDERVLKMAKAEWYEELKHFDVDDIKRGLDTYRGEFPPNMIQFSEACKADPIPLPPCYQNWESEPSLLKLESDESKNHRARGNLWLQKIRENLKTGKLE
ncbi:MAG: hypothetical protein ABFS32_22450 [Bacteroidota bacterium]